MAFLIVLQSMTPAERVTFILHDVFRYSFAEVAQIVGRTPAACRQLASSARRRLHASRAPATPTAQRAAIVRDFKQVAAVGFAELTADLVAEELRRTTLPPGCQARHRPAFPGEVVSFDDTTCRDVRRHPFHVLVPTVS